MKKCSTCKNEKQITEFGFDKYTLDGRNIRCRTCLKNIRSNKSFERKMEGSKACMHCKVVKEYSFFCNNKGNYDGLHVWCKECSRKKAKEYREKNPGNWERQRHKNFVNWRKKLGIDPCIKLVGKKGEGYVNRQGYLSYRKTGHPCADKNGRVQASHLVIYENTGKVLKKGESVHHKNGLRLDNRIENLEIWSKSQPAGQRIQDKVKWCIEFLDEYGYDVKKRD